MGSDEEYDWGAYDFNWSIFAEAKTFLSGLVDDFMDEHNRAAEMASTIEWGSATRFLDWIDHMVIPQDSVDEFDLQYLGFVEDTEAETMYGARCFRHMGSVLFPILLRPGNLKELAIKVHELDDFRKSHVRTAEIMGDPFAKYRWLDVTREHNNLLTAVERRGYGGYVLEEEYDINAYKITLDAFRTRNREFHTDGEGISTTHDLVVAQLDDLDTDRVADAWFRAEREYFASHCKAATIVKERQDHLGLGLANHDHHAYRCSREHFNKVVGILELLGLRKREAYFVGDQAGWGAQVMENPVGPFVAFCDMDLAADEQGFDFASKGFEPLDELGSIGLWVGLHGESMLQAGLHHLAIHVNFERAIQDLDTRNISCMPPFSDFDFLRQSFTVPERWSVDQERAVELMEGKFIGQDDLDAFGSVGATGSHLELIERNDGFKGFNQDSVSTIITHTDPRKGH